MWALKNDFLVLMSTMYRSFDRKKKKKKLFSRLFCIHYQYVSPNEIIVSGYTYKEVKSHP